MQKSNMLTDPLYISTQVRRKIHGDPRLNLATVAKYLGISLSGLSHAMARPDKMRLHARRVAQELKCPLGELTGLSDEESDKQLPQTDKHPQVKKRKAVAMSNGDEASLLAMISPNFNLRERFSLDRDCEVQRLPPGEGVIGGTYVLLGPARTAARINDRVFVLTRDGRKLVMRYNLDAHNRKLVILMPLTEGGSPVALEQSTIKEIRLIVGEFIVR